MPLIVADNFRPVQFTTLNRCKESPLQGRDANAGINCL